MNPGKEELALNIDLAEWAWLRAHLERDGLVLVAADLDLAEAGWRVASDDSTIIANWIESGKISKPTVAQVAQWDSQKDKQFQVLIVSPYVLFQDKELSIQ